MSVATNEVSSVLTRTNVCMCDAYVVHVLIIGAYINYVFEYEK